MTALVSAWIFRRTIKLPLQLQLQFGAANASYIQPR